MLAAALAGAAGLGLEAVLLSSAGLLLGYGRSGALGLACYVAGWALGALAFGRARATTRPLFLAAGALALAASWLAPWVLLRPVLHAAPDVVAVSCGCLALLAAAAPLGGLLILVVRAREALAGPLGRISVLWFASLVGSVAGAFAFADLAVGAWGRPPAAAAAGLLAAATALFGAWLAPAGVKKIAPEVSPAGRPADPRARVVGGGGGMDRLAPRTAGLLVGLATAWALGIEWVGLRLGVLWLGGMQDALHAILAASLLALAAGAALLPVVLPRGRIGVLLLFLLLPVTSAWLVLGGPAVAEEEWGSLRLALVLVGPALFPFGAVVPVVYRASAVGRAEGGVLGALLVHEAWGALVGGPLVHWFFVPAFGLGGAVAALSLVAVGAAALLLGLAWTRPLAVTCAGVAIAVCAVLANRPEPARNSPKLANPALTLLAFEEDADFAVAVVDDGVLGERTLLTDGFRAAGTGRDYRYMRALGHLPVLLHRDARNVCVIALGTGTTVGAVSLHTDVERIDVLELSRAVVRQAPFFEEVNRGALDDPRVEVLVGDGRRTLAARPGAYDAITLEPLLPDSPFAVYLYTREFYAAARRALAPGGLFCQWVPPHALEPATFDAVVDAFARSFDWASLWLFGTQLVLIGGETRPVAGEILDNFVDDTATALGRDLTELGLDSLPRCLARYVGDGADWPQVPRPLTDADPWVIYRPRREGVELLLDLPRNLRAIGAVEREPPWLEPEWTNAVDRWRALRALARAREAHAWTEAALRGAEVPPLVPDRDAELARAQTLLAEQEPDVALALLVDELRFLDALRSGVSRLAAGDFDAAITRLTIAAELRRERGDVHLYLAVALQGNKSEKGARAAWDEARARCPRILSTPAGRRALALGFLPPGDRP